MGLELVQGARDFLDHGAVHVVEVWTGLGAGCDGVVNVRQDAVVVEDVGGRDGSGLGAGAADPVGEFDHDGRGGERLVLLLDLLDQVGLGDDVHLLAGERQGHDGQVGLLVEVDDVVVLSLAHSDQVSDDGNRLRRQWWFASIVVGE